MLGGQGGALSRRASPLFVGLLTLLAVGLVAALAAYTHLVSGPGLGILLGATGLAIVVYRAELAYRDAADGREAALELLAQARAHLSDVFDAAPDPIIVLGADGKPSHINAAAQEAFGNSVPKVDEDAIARAEDGRTFEFAASRVALEGGSYGAILMGRDVTDRERTQELLRRSERLSALGTLVAGVAHEVNNPLMYLEGHLEIALDELKSPTPDHKAVRAAIDTALKGARRIEFVSQGLRAVIRNAPASHAPVRINGIVEEVANLLRGALPANVGLVVDLDPADPLIHGDPHELHQVVVNLARNAVEAVSARGGNVAITTSAAGGSVEVRVHDDGPGVPEDVRAKLFTPFYTTKAEGTGLGLAIVHSIVDAHKGDITLESEPGKGATFHVRLPIRSTALMVR